MKICIIAHFAYGAITGGTTGHAGGVERQTSLMAKWLAAKGHTVSFLTWDEGQADEELVDGVRVIKMCRQDDGIPIVRFFTPRWTSLIKGLRKADADIYYHNCAEYVTGQAAIWCKLNNRMFIYSSANTPDCDPKLPEFHTLREKLLFRYGLTHSDRVIVQTRIQHKMLLEGWGIDSTILPMPCPGPSEDEYTRTNTPDKESPRALWVGRISPIKRLEMLLDIAEKLPSIHFDVAGKPDVDNDYSRAVLSRANSLANVTTHGKVERKLMPNLYQNAHVLVCTSIYEGFPNTFLEAWSYGLPIITTFDPDSLIGEEALGVAVSDSTSVIEALKDLLLDNREKWLTISNKARNHYLRNYTEEPVMKRYEALFQEASDQITSKGKQ